MIPLNNINLLEKFRELKARPHTKSGFNAVVISKTSPHRLGITSEGYPIFFIACSSSERVSDINLRLFKVLFNRRCTISDTTTESDIQGTFSIIQLTKSRLPKIFSGSSFSTFMPVGGQAYRQYIESRSIKIDKPLYECKINF